MQHADPLAAILLGVFAAAVLLCLWRARRGHIPYVREIPGIASLQEAVGRATEMGRPIVFAMGFTDVRNIRTHVSLSVLSHVARLAARMQTELIVTLRVANVYPVAEEVVRHASCPVLTLREAESPGTIEAMEKILVPVDFSPYSEEALSYAKELAALYGAGLQLLHTIEEPAYPYFYNPGVTFSPIEHLEALRVKAEEAMDKLLAETKGPEVPAERFVATGRPSSEIAGFAEEHGSDLVVIATHGLTGLERLLVGSTAEHVVRLAPCPVFTVKSFGKSLI